jgi:hypothetical protein
MIVKQASVTRHIPSRILCSFISGFLQENWDLRYEFRFGRIWHRRLERMYGDIVGCEQFTISDHCGSVSDLESLIMKVALFHC